MKRTRVNEWGFIGGLEGMAFGVLIFVMGTLVVVNAWGVIDAKMATSSAAREAARAYVESDSPIEAEQSARTAADLAMAGYNRSVSNFQLITVDGFGRCARVAALVESTVQRIPIPFLDRAADSFTVRARHSEIVDPYRAGLDGEAICPD